MSNEGMDFEHEKSETYSELPATNEIKPEQELFDKSTEGTESDSTRRDEALSKEEIRQELFGESTENIKDDSVGRDEALSKEEKIRQELFGESTENTKADNVSSDEALFKEEKIRQELFSESTENIKDDSVGRDEALSKEEETRQELFGESTEGIECDRIGNDETSSREEEMQKVLFHESTVGLENVNIKSYDGDNPSDENKEQKPVLDNQTESISENQPTEITNEPAETTVVEKSPQMVVDADVEKDDTIHEEKKQSNELESELEQTEGFKDIAVEQQDRIENNEKPSLSTAKNEKCIINLNCSYEQGNNELGYQGTCGLTSVANALNTVFNSKEYSENSVVKFANECHMCSRIEETHSYELAGGTTTRDLESVLRNIDIKDKGIEFKTLEYNNAPSIYELAELLHDSENVAIVGVDSATLWDERDASLSWLFMGPEVDASDHWILVESPVYSEKGELEGFNIVDSGGGESFVSAEKIQFDVYRR